MFPELNETLQDQILWLLNLMETSFDPADDWFDVAAKTYTNYHVCEGDLGINWRKRGYGTILDILMVGVYYLTTIYFIR